MLSTYYFSTHTFDLHFQVVYKYDWDCPQFNINILFIFIYVHEDDGQMISPMLLSIQEAHNRLHFLPFLLLQKSISNTTECKKRVHCIGDVLTEECDVSNKIGIKSLFFWYWMNLRVPWLTFGIISYRYVPGIGSLHEVWTSWFLDVWKMLNLFLNWFRLNLFFFIIFCVWFFDDLDRGVEILIWKSLYDGNAAMAKGADDFDVTSQRKILFMV